MPTRKEVLLEDVRKHIRSAIVTMRANLDNIERMNTDDACEIAFSVDQALRLMTIGYGNSMAYLQNALDKQRHFDGIEYTELHDRIGELEQYQRDRT